MNSITAVDIERIVSAVLLQLGKFDKIDNLKNSQESIPAEISAKHVHLDKTSLELLFGKGYNLTPVRDLSQPGQFLAQERVKLVTEKGEICNVAVLGPLRDHIQVELSCTDANSLGLTPPLRLSGDLRDASDVIIVGPKGVVFAKESTIIAKAHIHMTENDAKKFSLANGDHVCVRLLGSRPITYEDVIVRVSEKSALALHIDYDEANAALFTGKGSALIVNKSFVENSFPDPISRTSNKQNSDLEICTKRLINEKDARVLVNQGILEPPLGAMVTPSAKDIFNAAGKNSLIKSKRG